MGFAVRAVKKVFAAAGREEWNARVVAGAADLKAPFATVETAAVSRNGCRIVNAIVDCCCDGYCTQLRCKGRWEGVLMGEVRDGGERTEAKLRG